MYYEVHLTTYPFPATRLEQFETACKEVNTKLVVIELAKGQTSLQPMATLISFDPYVKLLELIIKLNCHFQSKNFPISRTKIEIPFDYYE
jgi:hypothetical protein